MNEFIKFIRGLPDLSELNTPESLGNVLEKIKAYKAKVEAIDLMLEQMEIEVDLKVEKLMSNVTITANQSVGGKALSDWLEINNLDQSIVGIKIVEPKDE